MAGYIRQDTTNNIADGNIINASDFDNEYNAIEAAFNATTGHTHDGTSAEGAPITKVGPAQDLVIGASSATPKTTNTMDLGSSALKFKDVYAAGTAYIASLDLTNALAVADGGTGASTLTGYVKGNGTSAFTANSTIPVSDLTGTLPVSNGGTGATTLTANNVLIGNGTSAVGFVAPSTSGNILTSDGTTWTSTAPSVTASGNNTFSGNNSFTGANTFYNTTGQTFSTTTSTNDGVIISGRAGGSSSYRVTLQPTSLTANRTLTLPDVTGTVLTSQDTIPVSQGGTGLTTLTANSVILGNGTFSPQFIAPSTSGNVLTSNGTTWTSSAPSVTASGNNAFTGANTFYNSTGQTFSTATSTNDGIVLAGRAGGTLSYRVTLQPTTLTASRTLTLPDNSGTILTSGATVTVAQGGTGATTLTANNVILGNGTSAPLFVAPSTSGNILTSNGTTWTSAAPAITLAGNNAFTGANTFYNATGQTFSTATSTNDGVIIAGRAGGASSYRVTLQPTTLTASRTLTLPDNTGTVLTTGATVTVAQGGTGATTLTANNVILGNGTSAPLFVAPGTSGNVLTSNGTTWTSAAATGASVSANNAFTGANTFYNATGQTFGTATATQDGIILAGRAGGSSSYRVTLQPTTLTASRTLTLPDATTTIVGTDATQTLTNKRINSRVSSSASASSVTPDVASFDMYAYTALAADLTINAPTGTPVDGTKLMFRILDNGTARALTWNATYTVIGVTLPTTTTTNKTIYVGCVYNAGATRWDVIAVTTQA